MHISIIEDDKDLALRLNERFIKDWYFVTLYFSFNNFMRFPNFKSNLFLINLSLYDWSWFEIIRYIREVKKLNTPIIIISSDNNEKTKIDWLDLWADDYLYKSFSFDELLARIRAILRRKNNSSNNSILKYNKFSLNLKSKRLFFLKKHISLTNQETKLVSYFMSNTWVLISKVDIINSVWWDYEATNVTDNTINVTISKIRKKLWKDFKLYTKINEWYILEN